MLDVTQNWPMLHYRKLFTPPLSRKFPLHKLRLSNKRYSVTKLQNNA